MLFAVSAHAEEISPALSAPESTESVRQFLDQRGLQVTTTADEAKAAGYILALGIGKGPQIKAQRAATVSAQRAIVVLLADLQDGESNKQQASTTKGVTKRTVSGKVKGAVTVFNHYDTEQQTMYLLMKKKLPTKQGSP